MIYNNLYAVKMSKENYNYGSTQNPVDNSLRIHSLPFITGDTFRFFSDHTYDEVADLDPDSVNFGDSVYVSGWFLKSFFETKHHLIKEKYILISGNSCIDIDDFFLPYLEDDKLHHFFSQNVVIKHPKLTCIPVGIANSFWPHGNVNTLSKVISDSKNAEKKFLVSMALTPNTNSNVRQPIYDFFCKKDFCKVFSGSYQDYLNTLSVSYFTISPFGYGLDCYRVWESCLVGCIPIVQTSPLDELYRDLPVLTVDDYFQITEDFLWEKSIEIRKNIAENKYNLQKLYFAYWAEMIKKFQINLRTSDL